MYDVRTEPKLVKSLTFNNVQNIDISDGARFCTVMDKLSVDVFELHVLSFPTLETVCDINTNIYS